MSLYICNAKCACFNIWNSDITSIQLGDIVSYIPIDDISPTVFE